MEIKIIKDGLKNKDGGPLHTYEYSLKSNEIIVWEFRKGNSGQINGTYRYEMHIMKFAFYFWKLHSI